MTRVDLAGIRAGYTAEVLRGITTTFGAGELTALLGPSGCGKTTLLKVLAGLLPAAGHLRFDGDEIGPLPPEKREVAVVFQKPLLFPHLDVQANVAFGLKMRGRAEDVTPMLALTGVEALARRKVSELSGGQEQRVALARALVTRPRLLLLDEPFSALDETLRAQMRTLVRRLQRELKTTTVFVTHDQEEASLVADRIVLLLDGRVEQAGPPAELYSQPATAAAARFFGWQLLGPKRPPCTRTTACPARFATSSAGPAARAIRWPSTPARRSPSTNPDTPPNPGAVSMSGFCDILSFHDDSTGILKRSRGLSHGKRATGPAAQRTLHHLR
jgi:ABC-type Fe3+/spermidine/putrescine transport system ATPase subunit